MRDMKIVGEVVDSVVWLWPPPRRCLAITMLVMADRDDGIVRHVTAESLAAAARMPPEMCASALEWLVEHDHVELVADGFKVSDQILSLREMQTTRQIQLRDAQRRHRERQKNGTAKKKAKKAAPRKPRALALPDDFAPNDTAKKIAAELGLNLDYEVQQFRDYWTSRGESRADWQASLRTWLRRSGKDGKPRRGPVQSSTGAGAALIEQRTQR